MRFIYRCHEEHCGRGRGHAGIGEDRSSHHASSASGRSWRGAQTGLALEVCFAQQGSGLSTTCAAAISNPTHGAQATRAAVSALAMICVVPSSEQDRKADVSRNRSVVTEVRNSPEKLRSTKICL